MFLSVRTHVCVYCHVFVCIGRPSDLSVSHCVKQGCWHHAIPSSLSLLLICIHKIMQTSIE